MWGGTALARPTCNAKQVLEGKSVKLNSQSVQTSTAAVHSSHLRYRLRTPPAICA